MKKLLIIFLAAVICLSFVACGNETPDGDNDDDGLENTIGVKIVLDDARVINLELYPDIAPVTVANFLGLVDSGYYEDTVFHRVIAGFMIQTGWLSYASDGFKFLDSVPSIIGEFSENNFSGNNLLHTAGTISMARGSENDSASAQFFICSDDSHDLDGKYAAFGRVTDDRSLEIIKEISRCGTANITIGGTNFENFPASNDGGSKNSAMIIRISKIVRIN